jgi:FixJ family two-component response regulator
VPDEPTPLISIVDDDESIREAVEARMKSLGFHAQTFSSAVDFLASPGIANTSCVISDINMPHMTGVELYKNLVDLGYEIPTILITAYPNDEVRASALADGVKCYLVKPFDDEELVRCVRYALSDEAG